MAGLGFKYADVTDNHPGGILGREFGFTATASLDDNPQDVLDLFTKHGLTATSVCAHANLLDPSSPARYATNELMKAVRLAAGMGVQDVITTEGDPKSAWGHSLSWDEKVFVTAEKLHEPLRLAKAYGVRILLEPHGELTNSIKGMQAIMDRLGNPDHLGVNMDTGNSWLGGADPVEMATVFKRQDLPHPLEGPAGRLGGQARDDVRLRLRPHRPGRGRHRHQGRLRRAQGLAPRPVLHPGGRRRRQRAEELRVSEVAGRRVSVRRY